MSSFSVRFQDLTREKDEAKYIEQDDTSVKSKEHAGQWIIIIYILYVEYMYYLQLFNLLLPLDA